MLCILTPRDLSSGRRGHVAQGRPMSSSPAVHGQVFRAGYPDSVAKYYFAQTLNGVESAPRLGFKPGEGFDSWSPRADSCGVTLTP